MDHNASDAGSASALWMSEAIRILPPMRGGEYIIATTVKELIIPDFNGGAPVHDKMIIIVVVSSDLREVRFAVIAENLHAFDPYLPQATLAIPELLEVVHSADPATLPQLRWNGHYFNLKLFDGHDEVVRRYLRHAMREYVRVVELCANDPAYSPLGDRVAQTAQVAREIMRSWDAVAQ